MEEVNEMHKIILPIDTKSLYYNVLNDNIRGHTCTVATPIKQGNSTNAFLKDIYIKFLNKLTLKNMKI